MTKMESKQQYLKDVLDHHVQIYAYLYSRDFSRENYDDWCRALTHMHYLVMMAYYKYCEAF